jgi:DNA primase catalytic core
MARLPDETVTRIKQEVSLVRLAEARGFALKPHGQHYAIHCPFHADDKTPSLIITPEKNLFHCPACGAKGSPIDWVMKLEGVSMRHALELLANDLPHLVADNSPPKVVKRARKQKLPPLLSANADHQTALRQVIGYYHETLKASPEALAYLESRGLKSAELIDTFKLGYANRTLAYRLPAYGCSGGEIRDRLKAVGLLRESTGHEHFNGCLVAPVINEQGLITEVYGRKVGQKLNKVCARHLYLPGPHEGVWNAQAVRHSREVILCESLIDAMTFWVHGFRNVTASYGTAGFTDELLALLVACGVEKVLIAYDRDEAGNRAADKLAKWLNENGMDAYRVLFPKGMDANEYALQVTPAEKSLGLALRKAQWLGNGQGRSSVAEGTTPGMEEVERSRQPEPRTPGATNGKNKLEPKAVSEPATQPETVADPDAPPHYPPLAAETLAANPEETLIDAVNIEADIAEHEIHINLSPRHYRIRGLNKNLSYEQLKINLLIQQGEAFHVDTFDLYSAKARAVYVKQAAEELGIPAGEIKADLGKVLLKLEALQERQIKGALAKQEKQPAMSDDEVKEALALLKDPVLLDRILQDFNQCGVVGEETNKLTGYLAACSRKLERPLAVMVQSSSAAGKSSLMEAVLAFMPEEERIQYSAMTGQALFYLGEQDLKHKILAIAEEEGAEQTSYALKLLQSEGEVSIASTGKNAVTGNLETQEYRVEGPVMLFSTTTAIDIDEELMNRCLVLSVDESRAQTQAIHAAQRQRRTLAGLKAKKEKERLIRLHQNAQRLLRPLAVMNPYADQLTFLDDKTRTRRDHEKYLGLIDVIALLHQYQRAIKREQWEGETLEYIEVTLNDIATANRLAHEVLGRSLDELPPQTRRLLSLTVEWVAEQCQQEDIKQRDYRFSRKDVRALSGWTDFQVKKHLCRLEELEYVLVHSGSRGKSIVYELLYQGEGEDGESFLMGLLDVKRLGYDDQKEPPAEEKEPQNGKKEPPSSPQSAPKEPSSCPGKNAKNPINNGVNGDPDKKPAKSVNKNNNNASHRSPALAAHSRPHPGVEV